MAQYDKLINEMAKTLSEDRSVHYAEFIIKTIYLQDGRLAEFTYRLEPIECPEVE